MDLLAHYFNLSWTLDWRSDFEFAGKFGDLAEAAIHLVRSCWSSPLPVAIRNKTRQVRDHR